MTAKYWIKLYHEILDDPKMGRLPDRLWRRTIELFLLAGDCDEDGYLPSVEDIAWRLRLGEEEIETDMIELQRVGILSMQNGRWFVTKFAERQAPMDKSEYMKRLREERKKEEYYQSSDQSVTDSNTDTDKNREDKSLSAPVDDILQVWSELFPKKPQPRASTSSIRNKLTTRWKSEHFQEHWREALEKAAKSPTLHKESWFDFRFFIRNDENYQKCLDNWMAWKDERIAQNKSSGNLPEGV